MKHHLTKKFLTLVFACGLTAITAMTATAQERQAGARQNSTGVAAVVAQPAPSQVQSSDVPLMGALAVVSSSPQPTQQVAATARPDQTVAPAQASPVPAQTPAQIPAQIPAPTPLPVVAPTPLPNLAPTPQPTPATQTAPEVTPLSTPLSTPQSTPQSTSQSPGSTPAAGASQTATPSLQVVIQSNATAESSLTVPSVAPDYRATLGSSLPALERVGVNMAEQRPLALREAIELALQNGKDIEVARTNVRAAEFDLTAARGARAARSRPPASAARCASRD
jgi:outer membrane biosynthesis protein TonB